MKRIVSILICISFLFLFMKTQAQSVTIKEETKALDTYGFGKPNPVPILSDNPKIFPYFKFEEYDHTSKKKDWKVVTLENDYIKVFVLPEIGGKVWGAIEKSTGEEFLYKNEVIKFRNIAMRGPWTSGGIEFNFGIIGHHPSTATAVDYITRTNEDGSVSCIVGNTDLPSNTTWTVEIRLENDKAYFETNASWYNASPITESYYNWMTAAAEATYDLEFFIPGNTYVEHNGTPRAWPIDPKGRDLAFYKNNTFGPSKSYHIVGEYNDFFGGYYHDKKFGFGQWAPYEEMPGQKLWLWNLSRAGGIWEDLLTDSDGQYIEFQAGRLFDQYSPGDAINPISQVGFDPYVMDRWSELWFPYKEIGGMVDASEHGVLNVETTDNEAYIGLNALQKLDNEIQIKVNGQIVFTEKLELSPMEIFSKSLSISPTDEIEVVLNDTELAYKSGPVKSQIKRHFEQDTQLNVSESQRLLFEGIEALEFREYKLAHEKFSELIQKDPSHQIGLIKLAELEYRKTNYQLALQHANAVLRMDTYNTAANYIAGITYRAIQDYLNALESLGWAARDVKFRSVAYAQMAEIHLATNNQVRAQMYAEKALDFNTYNLNARKVLLVIQRMQENKDGFKRQLEVLLGMAPLDHFAIHELTIMNNEPSFGSEFHNEFKEETVLQGALDYYSLGLVNDATSTLSKGSKSSKNKLWSAYLFKDSEPSKSISIIEEVVTDPIDFVFPYRKETIPVLEWAVQQNTSWKLNYLLAQNYLAVGLEDQGKSILKTLGELPDSGTFYRFRAKILSENGYSQKLKDIQKAMSLNNKDWKVWEETIHFYLKNKKYAAAHTTSKKAYKKFQSNYNIGLAHAKSLLNVGEFEKVIQVLKNIRILPYEHASESRKIYEQAHIGSALKQIGKKNFTKAIKVLEQCKQWPENIGVGKPYNPDERMQDYLLAKSYAATKRDTDQNKLLNGIVDYTKSSKKRPSINNLYSLLALKELGKEEALGQIIKRLSVSEQRLDTLVLAFFNNEKQKLVALKNKSNLSDNQWNAMELSVE